MSQPEMSQPRREQEQQNPLPQAEPVRRAYALPEVTPDLPPPPSRLRPTNRGPRFQHRADLGAGARRRVFCGER